MTKMKQQKRKMVMRPFGTLAFQWLWRFRTSKGALKRKHGSYIKQHPIGNERHMGSFLKRCSANERSESGKGRTVPDQSEKTPNGEVGPSKRHSQQEKTTHGGLGFSNKHDQPEKTTQGGSDCIKEVKDLIARSVKFYRQRHSANLHNRKVEEDTAIKDPKTITDDFRKRAMFVSRCLDFYFENHPEDQHNERAKEDANNNQPGKTTNSGLKPQIFFPVASGLRGSNYIRLPSRSRTGSLQKRKSLTRVLSPRAAKLYKGGTPLQIVVRSLGARDAFTHWRDGTSISVKLRPVGGGAYSISRVGGPKRTAKDVILRDFAST